ncbi:MAG: hypothetical protein AAF221_07980 [Pseudomonadota bacterium]
MQPQAIQTPTNADQHHQEVATALMAVTNDLTALLTDESNMLVKGQSEDIAALSGRKAELFSAYQKSMATIKAAASPRLMIQEDVRQALRKGAQRFKVALERNQQLLEKRMESSQQLMTTIGKEVQRQQNPVQTYQSPHTGSAKQAPTSLAVNQTI